MTSTVVEVTIRGRDSERGVSFGRELPSDGRQWRKT